MTYNRIKVKPLSGGCGAEIFGVDLSEDLGNETFAEVQRAFHENLVIFFRDQDLTEDQHKKFGGRFGSLNVHPRYVPLEGHPEIFPIRKDPEHTKIVGGSWHQDLTHLEKPPLGSILYALDVPSVGGDTLFANQYLAYEALSEGMRKMLDKLVAVHDNRVQAPNATPERNAKMTSKLRDDPDEEDEPEMEHPVVRTHPETGRKALFVCRPRTHRSAARPTAPTPPWLGAAFLVLQACLCSLQSQPCYSASSSLRRSPSLCPWRR